MQTAESVPVRFESTFQWPASNRTYSDDEDTLPKGKI